MFIHIWLWLMATLFIAFLICPVRVFAETTNKKDLAQSLWEEGKKAFDDKDYETALKKFNNSLNLYREMKDRQSEADLLTWLAATNIELDNFNEALILLKESQGIYEDFNASPGEKAAFKDIDKAMEAINLYIEGIEHLKAENYKSAIKKLNEVLLLFREMGIKNFEAAMLAGIGTVYEKIKNYEKAIT